MYDLFRYLVTFAINEPFRHLHFFAFCLWVQHLDDPVVADTRTRYYLFYDPRAQGALLWLSSHKEQGYQ